VNEEDDPSERANAGRFPLSIDDITKAEKVIKLVREQLSTMSPAHVRTAASVLLALEHLPATTPGIQVTFGFVQRNTDGNYGWADITISEDEFRLGVGEHYYDPSVGGDTETRIAFEAQAGGEWTEGDIDDWLPVANVIATEGDISMEDYSDYEAIEHCTNRNAQSRPRSRDDIRPDRRRKAWRAIRKHRHRLWGYRQGAIRHGHLWVALARRRRARAGEGLR
jgi:hypothetical protein